MMHHCLPARRTASRRRAALFLSISEGDYSSLRPASQWKYGRSHFALRGWRTSNAVMPAKAGIQ
jgi:hypothetical protein